MSSELYDVFLFDNEVDILRWRLHELEDVVDYFVIVEGTHTFQGEPRPTTWYQTQPDPCWDPWREKIVHVLVDDAYKGLGRGGAGTPLYMARERQARNAVGNILRPTIGDIVLLSDVDEIPSADAVQEAHDVLDFGNNEMVLFEQRWFTWSFKWLYPINNLGTTAIRWSDESILLHDDVRAVRVERSTYIINPGGWHLSWFGGVEQNKHKLFAFSHAELRHKFDEFERMHSEGKDINGFDLTTPAERNEPWPMMRIFR